MKRIEAKVEHIENGAKAHIIALIISLVVFSLGFIGTYSYYYDVCWYGIEMDYEELYIPILSLLILGQAIVFISRLIYRKQAKLTSLYVESDKVYGSFGKFSKREIVIPIEQLDNVIVTDTFADKYFRSGKTLILCSASGKIKFHMIQNTEEIFSEVISFVNEYKRSYGNASMSSDSENQAASSNADEIKKYKKLLDSGIISQKEFEAKKKQLLGL